MRTSDDTAVSDRFYIAINSVGLCLLIAGFIFGGPLYYIMFGILWGIIAVSAIFVFQYLLENVFRDDYCPDPSQFTSRVPRNTEVLFDICFFAVILLSGSFLTALCWVVVFAQTWLYYHCRNLLIRKGILDGYGNLR